MADEPLPIRALLPSVLVVILAIVGPQLSPSDRCAPSDGPQFRCWLLVEHG